jgi:hypothetical protein
MKLAVLRWVGFGLVMLGTVHAKQTEVRFSQTLNADERTAGGLVRLTSDEVADIDALERRDTLSRVRSTATENAPSSFSQRLTADERRPAGIAKLSETELPKLDALVDRFQSAKLARTLLAPPTYLSRASRVVPTEAKKEREIHGSFSLSYGFGSGGYSEKTGSMVLTMDDPARRFSITIGYSESHIKGGSIYRDPFYDRYDRGYDRDLFYDPMRDSLRNPPDVLIPTRP